MPKPILDECYVITDEACSYGCNGKAKYTFKNGKFCCSRTSNSCPEMKKRNTLGLKKAYKEGKFKDRKINYEKVADSVRSTYIKKIISMDWDDLGPNQKRYRVNLEQEGKCNTCSISEWLNKPVSLELDHIDGDRDNNSRENLRLLCPNCHSQTPTWKGKHKDKMRKLSDEDLIRIMKSSDNIRQTLLKAGMDPKSANYNKIKDILWSLIDKQDQ